MKKTNISIRVDSKMNNKKLLACLIFLFLTISTMPVEANSDTYDCEKLKDNNNNYYFCIAKLKQDESLCERIQDNSKMYCYQEVAIAKQNATLCEKIQNTLTKDYCYSSVAGKKQDVTLCEKIQDNIYKDVCYMEVAVAKGDLSLCSNVKNNYYGQCQLEVAIAKKDGSLCEKGWDSRKEICYFKVAMAKQDETLCEKIVSDGVGYNKWLCYQNIAIVKSDVSLCNKACGEDIPGGGYCFCYKEIAIAKQDPSLCEKAHSDETDCYKEVAIAKQDPSLCEKAHSEKDECYNIIAKAKQDVSLCEMIQYSPPKLDCYLNIATAKKNVLLCDKIQDDDHKNLCIAIIKQDAALCDNVSDYGWKRYCVAVTKQDESLCSSDDYDCYTTIAKLKRDASLCKKVMDSLQYLCYLDVALAKEDESVCWLINPYYKDTREECLRKINKESNATTTANPLQNLNQTNNIVKLNDGTQLVMSIKGGEKIIGRGFIPYNFTLEWIGNGSSSPPWYGFDFSSLVITCKYCKFDSKFKIFKSNKENEWDDVSVITQKEYYIRWKLFENMPGLQTPVKIIEEMSKFLEKEDKERLERIQRNLPSFAVENNYNIFEHSVRPTGVVGSNYRGIKWELPISFKTSDTLNAFIISGVTITKEPFTDEKINTITRDILLDITNTTTSTAIYDDFSGSILDTSKWKVESYPSAYYKPEVTGYVDEYFVDTSKHVFHTAQNTAADREVILTAKRAFSPGESIEYDVNYVTSTGNGWNGIYINHAQPGIIGPIDFIGRGGQAAFGKYHVKITFLDKSVNITTTKPDGATESYTLSGDTGSWWPEGSKISPPYKFSFSTRTGHIGTAHLDYDNFTITTNAGGQALKEVDKTVLLDVLFGLEQVKIKLDGLKDSALAISDYYSVKADTAKAGKWLEISNTFNGVVNTIDGIIAEIKQNKDNITADFIQKIKGEVADVKADISSVIDKILEVI